MSESNIRIARNTIFLYIRMFATMAVSLYTSRVVLKSLGVEDYGIYNVVGSVVALFAFLNSSMIVSTQRFFSFAIGKKDNQLLSQYFSASIKAMLIIALVAVLLFELIGTWLLENRLSVPIERAIAVKWVFHVSILTFVISILRIPYNSLIISHERMSFFAYVSIVEVLLKLLLAFAINWIIFDKLISYGFFQLFAVIIIFGVYYTYCKRNFQEAHFSIRSDSKTLKHILSFSSYSMIGGSAVLGGQQGGNILINIFHGVSANAAFGVATQLSAAINSFVQSFQTAFNPQITKLYANNQIKDLNLLVARSAIFSYYLFLIIAVPLAINIDAVLSAWLVEVPRYSSVFCLLMLSYFAVDAVQAPLWMFISSTGKLRLYTIWSSSLHILNIPISFFLLKQGLSPYIVLVVRFALNFVGAGVRTIQVSKMGLSVKAYLKGICIKVIPITILSLTASLAVSSVFSDKSIQTIIVISIISIVITGALIFFYGLNRNERQFFIRLLPKRNNT